LAAQRWAANPGPGAELLDNLLGTIKRYVIFPDDHAAVSTALWIAATHALPAFECAPRLVITSPEKRCGKTRLLDVIGGTCHRPLASANATVAAIFRSITDAHPRTLIIDEADTLFGSKKVAEQNEELRALLNAGHQRGRPALRCVGPNQTPTEFSTFAMAAIGGIGQMPDTITDRGVNIAMRRRAAGEQVAQFRSRRDGPILDVLREQLSAWAVDQIDTLRDVVPDMPVEDRAADTWEPLISVADAVGGHWPLTAREACVALVRTAATADEEQSLAVKLLADIREAFDHRGVPFLASADLVVELRALEDSPWNDFDLTPRKLAHRLKDFGVRPERNTVGSVRGYRLDTLHDLFQRYLRQDTSDLSETVPEQRGPSDTSKPSDGAKRQTKKNRQTEVPVQMVNLTDLTDPDGEPPKSNSDGSPARRPNPAAMPSTRHLNAVNPDGSSKPASCPGCGRAPARSNGDVCDFCAAKRERMRIS
ncbi:MAG: hypothetical protein QOH57_4414, partial [Mycobacterium sp.]|nr:hypothetical protein [Mycobacterium sp.]